MWRPSAERPHDAECGAFRVAEVLPGWRGCGPYAKRVPAILSSVAALPADRAAALARSFRDRPDDMVWPVWQTIDWRDPRWRAAKVALDWIHGQLLRSAPESAFDPWDLARNKVTLADEGWVRLHRAAFGAVLGAMFPDLPAVADQDLEGRWDSNLAEG